MVELALLLLFINANVALLNPLGRRSEGTFPFGASCGGDLGRFLLYFETIQMLWI